jgi:hypothetical protein
MSANTEDQRVKQPAIGLFAERGRLVSGPPPTAGVAGEPREAGIVGRKIHGERSGLPNSAGRRTCSTPLLPVESLLIAPNQWTGKLDPYWTHVELMVDPSADLSA